MAERSNNWISYFLFFTLAVSSFVVIEPSPYDLLIILLLIIGFTFSIYSFSKEMVFPIIILSIFLISNILSLFFIKTIGPSIFFTAITFYLALTWIGIIGLSKRITRIRLQFILHGYLISACLSAIIGILAFLNLIPFSDLFLMYGRAKALFKDPNVFGPFLVMPALFSLSMTERKDMPLKKKMFYYLTFLILIAAVIISFSRAAWGNLFISLFIYLFLFKVNLFKRRIHTVLFIVIAGIPIILFIIQTPLIEDLLVSRLSFQNYDNERFGTQLAAFESGISNPLGIGSGQSENTFKYSPHSLYARVFTENGVIGILSFSFFLIVSTFKALSSYWSSKREDGVFYVVIFASLIGLAFNSFFVDTLHWRHFWLLLALAWIPLNERRNEW
ncbi:O-antigen ligase family protein [Psychrobacillus sp. INOP01]|uniref:O-antigen ligase family protein n=1 Tax=Psychrobacillus sp. INOP01 TaxID=2829187 RepID=UPI001BAA5DD2|nr:O-antigen ligase family protein [Psychrobacillus sp. INOP01]QUG42563.1 O-antigen ligase family protein [Psychrobacillus sp. INOP01]